VGAVFVREEEGDREEAAEVLPSRRINQFSYVTRERVREGGREGRETSKSSRGFLLNLLEDIRAEPKGGRVGRREGGRARLAQPKDLTHHP